MIQQVQCHMIQQVQWVVQILKTGAERTYIFLSLKMNSNYGML